MSETPRFSIFLCCSILNDNFKQQLFNSIMKGCFWKTIIKNVYFLNTLVS